MCVCVCATWYWALIYAVAQEGGPSRIACPVCGTSCAPADIQRHTNRCLDDAATATPTSTTPGANALRGPHANAAADSEAAQARTPRSTPDMEATPSRVLWHSHDPAARPFKRPRETVVTESNKASTPGAEMTPDKPSAFEVLLKGSRDLNQVHYFQLTKSEAGLWEWCWWLRGSKPPKGAIDANPAWSSSVKIPSSAGGTPNKGANQCTLILLTNVQPCKFRYGKFLRTRRSKRRGIFCHNLRDGAHDLTLLAVARYSAAKRQQKVFNLSSLLIPGICV